MTEAEKNAETLRRGYAAFNAGDMKTLTEIFHENAVWHTPGRTSMGGDRKGRDAIFAHFGRYGGDTGGTFKANLLHVLADDSGHAVGIHRNTAERERKAPRRLLLPRVRHQGRKGERRARDLLRSACVGRVLVVGRKPFPDTRPLPSHRSAHETSSR